MVTKKRRLTEIAVISLTVLLFFLPVQHFPFCLLDDEVHIYANKLIVPFNAENLGFIWRYPFNQTPPPGAEISATRGGAPYKVIYTPLTYTASAVVALAAGVDNPSPAAVKRAGSLDPAVFHSFNLLLHVGNALLFFRLLLTLLRRRGLALAGALLFALHPLQIQTVVWCTGSDNLLCAAFLLIALNLYFTASNWAYAAATLCFGLSLLAKPSSAPAALALVPLAYCFDRRRATAENGVVGQPAAPLLRHYVLTLGPWCVLAAIEFLINRSMTDPADTGWAAPLALRPLIVGDAYAFYLTKLLFPFALSPDYGRTFSVVLQNWWGYCTWVPPAALVGLCLWKLRHGLEADRARWRWLLAGLGGAALMLLPTSGIVGGHFARFSTVTDRYMYLAFLFLIPGVLAWLPPDLVARPVTSGPMSGPDFSKRARPIWALAALWCVVALVAGRNYEILWGNDAAFWKYTVMRNPRSWTAWNCLTQLATLEGKYPDAIQSARQSLAQDPDQMVIRLILANSLAVTGQSNAADLEFRECLRRYPSRVETYHQYGVVLMLGHRYAEADAQFAGGLKVQPESGLLLGSLGLSQWQQGKVAASAATFGQALQHGFAEDVGRTYLGLALLRQGKPRQAEAQFSRVVQINPRSVAALTNLGILREEANDLPHAAEFLVQALRLAPDNAEACLHLGQVAFKQGKPEAARKLVQRSLLLRPKWAPALQALRAMGSPEPYIASPGAGQFGR